MTDKGIGAKFRLASTVSLLAVFLFSTTAGVLAEDKAKAKSSVATASGAKMEKPSEHVKAKAAPRDAEKADKAAEKVISAAKPKAAKVKTAKVEKVVAPNRALLYPLLQKAYGQMLKGQFQEAVLTCLDAVRADRDSVTARRYLAYALVQLKAPDEALQQMIMVSRMIRPTAFDLYTFGEAYLQSGNYAQAEDSFKGALGLDPNFLLAKGGLIKVMSSKGQYDDAFRACIDGLKASQDQTSQGFYRLLYAGVQEAKMNPVKPATEGGAPSTEAVVGAKVQEASEGEGTQAPVANPQDVAKAYREQKQRAQDTQKAVDAWAKFSQQNRVETVKVHPKRTGTPPPAVMRK